jgi:hypothetical protein
MAVAHMPFRSSPSPSLGRRNERTLAGASGRVAPSQAAAHRQVTLPASGPVASRSLVLVIVADGHDRPGVQDRGFRAPPVWVHLNHGEPECSVTSGVPATTSRVHEALKRGELHEHFPAQRGFCVCGLPVSLRLSYQHTNLFRVTLFPPSTPCQHLWRLGVGHGDLLSLEGRLVRAPRRPRRPPRSLSAISPESRRGELFGPTVVSGPLHKMAKL